MKPKISGPTRYKTFLILASTCALIFLLLSIDGSLAVRVMFAYDALRSTVITKGHPEFSGMIFSISTQWYEDFRLDKSDNVKSFIPLNRLSDDRFGVIVATATIRQATPGIADLYQSSFGYKKSVENEGEYHLLYKEDDGRLEEMLIFPDLGVMGSIVYLSDQVEVYREEFVDIISSITIKKS